MQRGFHRLARGLLHAIREQRVEPGAFVNFVEVHHRLAFEQHSLAVAAADRRAIGIVERALDQVAGRQQIFQSLLILDADEVAAKVVGQPHGGDVHLALQENLLVGEIGIVLRAGVEPHAALFHPLAHRGGFVVADLRRFVIQRRLAEPFLEHAGAMQQVVGHDGVEHAHAAFVEHAHDGFFAEQLFGEPLAQRSGRVGGRRICRTAGHGSNRGGICRSISHSRSRVVKY